MDPYFDSCVTLTKLCNPILLDPLIPTPVGLGDNGVAGIDKDIIWCNRWVSYGGPRL